MGTGWGRGWRIIGHAHGLLAKERTEMNFNQVYEIKYEIKYESGDATDESVALIK